MHTTKIAAALVLVMMFWIGTVSAMPLYPEEYPGWGGGGEDPPPELPAEGYWTVDSPAADTHNWVNAGVPYYAKNRGGGSATLWWLNWDIGYSKIQTGNYNDDNQHGHWTWPAQVMPLGNGTILDIWMIANVTADYNDYTGWLQWSLNGRDWFVTDDSVPDGRNISNQINFTLSETDYHIYGINITNARANWTPQDVMNPSFNVRLYSNNTPILLMRPLYVDYLGIRYNWTLNASAPSEPLYDFDDSPLASLDTGEIFIGGLGAFGVIGLVIFPAVAIWYYRHSDESKIMVAVQLISIMAFCFTLMLWAIG